MHLLLDKGVDEECCDDEGKCTAKEMQRINELRENALIGNGTYSSVYRLDLKHAVKIIRVGGIYLNKREAFKEVEVMRKL